MPVPMFAEKTPTEVQLSSNPKKRKMGHNDPASMASSPAAGLAPSSLEPSHNTTLVPPKTAKRPRLNQQPSSTPRHTSTTTTTAMTTTSPLHHDTSPKPIADLLLRPCHICWRRPTTRAVVDGYTDCDECGLRTCYICLRVCEDVDCQPATVDVLQTDHHRRLSSTSQPVVEVYTRKRRKRLCSWCVVEHVDADGRDMTLCLDCADRPQWPSVGV